MEQPPYSLSPSSLAILGYLELQRLPTETLAKLSYCHYKHRGLSDSHI